MHAIAGSLPLPIHDAAAEGVAARRLRLRRKPGAQGLPGHDARAQATVAAGFAEVDAAVGRLTPYARRLPA